MLLASEATLSHSPRHSPRPLGCRWHIGRLLPILVPNWPHHTMRIPRNGRGPVGSRSIHKGNCMIRAMGTNGALRTKFSRPPPAPFSPAWGPFITALATRSAQCQSTCHSGALRTFCGPVGHAFNRPKGPGPPPKWPLFSALGPPGFVVRWHLLLAVITGSLILAP